MSEVEVELEDHPVELSCVGLFTTRACGRSSHALFSSHVLFSLMVLRNGGGVVTPSLWLRLCSLFPLTVVRNGGGVVMRWLC